MSGETCIWCGRFPARSREHIAPDALGCPPSFILEEGVCATCNHRHGRLDRALLTPFEIITVLKGIPRKKRRKPTIDGYRSLSGGYDANGPMLFINREKYDVRTPNGKILRGLQSDDPIVDFSYQIQDKGTATISYSQQLRFTGESVRCLFKISLECIAFFEGLEAARSSIYDPVREYVRHGSGGLRAIMVPDQSSGYDHFYHPGFEKDGYSRMVGMTILGIGFVCDFDPAFKGGNMLVEEVKRQGMGVQVIPNWPMHLWRNNNNLGNA